MLLGGHPQTPGRQEGSEGLALAHTQSPVSGDFARWQPAGGLRLTPSHSHSHWAWPRPPTLDSGLTGLNQPQLG